MQKLSYSLIEFRCRFNIWSCRYVYVKQDLFDVNLSTTPNIGTPLANKWVFVSNFLIDDSPCMLTYMSISLNKYSYLQGSDLLQRTY